MMYTVLHTWAVLLFVTKMSYGIPIADFYPFGQSEGDSTTPTSDDGSSPAVNISPLFPFFNSSQDRLYVNTNGLISFGKSLTRFGSRAFPTDDGSLIAPFWADVDIRKGGTIWYRETTTTTILQRATDDVNLFFPSLSGFVATWVLIATWDDVAFFGANSNTVEKRNTFQAVLITNGQQSFAIYNYYEITWTTGTASGGNFEGLGGTPAQVGFNAGDGINFYAIDESRTGAIINLPQLSNVDVDGKFVFRIDTETIEQNYSDTGVVTTTIVQRTETTGPVVTTTTNPTTETTESIVSTTINPTTKTTESIVTTTIDPITETTGSIVTTTIDPTTETTGSIVTTTIDPTTETTGSNSWIILVVIGVASVFGLIIIILAFIVLVRCFCWKKDKATDLDDRAKPTYELDNIAYKSDHY